MTILQRAWRLSPLVAALAALPAFATDGYFPHGYGLKAKGMGGASLALVQDAMGGATNPATMVWAGNVFNAGADVFMPHRDAERTGAGFPTLDGRVESGRTAFFVPELGYNRMMNDRMSFGVTVYGNGGMNTSYPQGNFNCGAGPSNMLCGSGGLGVDLMQLVVAPTVSYKLAPNHSIGASLLLGYQMFKATGLQAFDNAPGFPPFTSAPGSVTNRGTDNSYGVGIRIGYLGRLTDRITVGASYSPKMSMSRFDKYKGLFAGQGKFDLPENYGVGVAFVPASGWRVALDYQRIAYSGVPAVGNASLPVAPLGAANGPGFGWRDVDVIKLGAEWQMNPQLTLRAGYNHGSNPIRGADVTFNILAPGVITSHYTAGFTYALNQADEITGAFMYAPRRSVSGSSLFNAVMGAGAAGTETISMKEYSVGLGWTRRF